MPYILLYLETAYSLREAVSMLPVFTFGNESLQPFSTLALMTIPKYKKPKYGPQSSASP